MAGGHGDRTRVTITNSVNNEQLQQISVTLDLDPSLFTRYIYLFKFHGVHYLCQNNNTDLYQITRYPAANVIIEPSF